MVGVGAKFALFGGWSAKSEALCANLGTMHCGIANGCTTGWVNADVKNPDGREVVVGPGFSRERGSPVTANPGHLL